MNSQRLIHLINFSRKLAVNAVFFLIPLHLLRIGFTGWQIGIAVSLFAFAPLLFSFPTGWLNDRFSVKEIVHFGLAVLSLVFLLIGRTHHFLAMAFLFLLLGMANNALDVSTNSFIFKDETKGDLNRKYSRLAFWQALGSAAGVLIAGIIIASSSFQALFVILAFFLLLIQIFVRRLQQVRFALVPFTVYRSNIFRLKTILFIIMIFIVGLHWGVEGTIYSPFLRDYFHLSTFQLSLYISLTLLALAFSSFLIGLLRHNPRVNRRIFLLAMFLSGAGLFLMVNRSLTLSFAFRIIHEVGDGLLGALVVLYISQLFEKASIGGSAAILLAFMTFGNMVGALVFSSIGFHFGLSYPFFIAGLLLVANSGFALYCFSRVQY